MTQKLKLTLFLQILLDKVLIKTMLSLVVKNSPICTPSIQFVRIYFSKIKENHDVGSSKLRIFN